MASSGLPSGAFLTTIQGRRCTAIPKAAAAITGGNGVTLAATTTSSVRTTVVAAASSSVRTTAKPTTGLAAAPAEDADARTAIAEQSSASTTSSFLVITTSISSGSVGVAQAQDSDPGPSARPSTTFLTAFRPAFGATLQSFTALADVTSSQASVAQSSQADGNVTAPAADTLATSSQAGPAETSSPILPEGPAANPLLTTFEAPQTPTDSVVAEATGATSVNPTLDPIPALNNNAVQSTVAVAGGVIGGVVAISVLAFLIWWWRRRLQRKRRSTLLTPLDVGSSSGRDEMGDYVISRGSIGPTPVTEKVKAALGQNFKKIRGHIRNKTVPSVNLDRGPSQFIDPASARGRGNSGTMTSKDRLKGWWSELAGSIKLGRRNKTTGAGNSTAIQEKKAASSSQPDFLTLLNMDDQSLDREAQRRRASIARLNGSTSSTDNFLGGLNLTFSSGQNEDPFSDANAIAHTSAQPPPLAIGSKASPFSDANAIRDPAPAMPKPATYVANIRRSRTNSIATRRPSTYNNRESAGSLVSMATATTTTNQRNKFRSDPFDLERPELLGDGGKTTTVISPLPVSDNSSSKPTAADRLDVDMDVEEPKYPSRTRAGAAAARIESYTSRYSEYSNDSAVSSTGSMGDWSDPGPDVGPAATRYPTQQLNENGVGSAQGGKRMSRGSLGSLRSVGKAM
ncbi:hypothetical protein C8A03DRAFT_31150 [Achaetomium macrosporum]|uniref:Uncharacterized protein n=1 Tax=Achaetomium macrosporum TaxID=79813 RepID=A0AAN7CFC7_9PEZI|nr:hypothetical protein C8A03DRAFT_31150 [Achaetomium macrosporum]